MSWVKSASESQSTALFQQVYQNRRGLTYQLTNVRFNAISEAGMTSKRVMPAARCQWMDTRELRIKRSKVMLILEKIVKIVLGFSSHKFKVLESQSYQIRTLQRIVWKSYSFCKLQGETLHQSHLFQHVPGCRRYVFSIWLPLHHLINTSICIFD